MRTQKDENPVNVDSLIELEWDMITDLRKMISEPNSQLSAAERIRAANALAYHATVLNKLLSQKGEDSRFNDSTLAEFVKNVEPRMARRVRTDFKHWTKRLSLTR